MRIKLMAGVVALLCIAASAAAAQEEWSWRSRVAAGRTVEIKGVNGDVSAVFASGNEVRVTAVKRARRSDPEDVKIEVVEHGDGVTICAVYPTPRRSRHENACAPGDEGHMNTENNDVQVTFTVYLPAGVRLSANTVNGDIEAAQLRSDLEATTVNGSIRLSTSGIAEATTVNGSITAAMGRADWTGALQFQTVNGGIALDLPRELNTEVTAHTVNGDIQTDYPLMVQGRISPRRLRGTIGSGGRSLMLETVNGSIALRKASS